MKRRELFKLIKKPPRVAKDFVTIRFGFGYTPYPDNSVQANSSYIGSLYYYHCYKNIKTNEIFNVILVKSIF